MLWSELPIPSGIAMHRYVVVGVAYPVRYRDVFAFEVLRALNRRVGEDVERFASRVYAGREFHAHAVDGGDEHRSDVVARYVYLARAYRVGLRAGIVAMWSPATSTLPVPIASVCALLPPAMRTIFVLSPSAS